MMKMKQSVSQIGSRDPYNNIRLLKVPPPRRLSPLALGVGRGDPGAAKT